MDRYAVFGHPVRHSKSPFIHTLFARQTQQQLEYGLADPEPDEFAAALRSFFAEGARGAILPCLSRSRPSLWSTA